MSTSREASRGIHDIAISSAGECLAGLGNIELVAESFIEEAAELLLRLLVAEQSLASADITA